jgi:hypothetical protein
MNRQEILLKSGATLIVDNQQFRKIRRAELTKKIGYSNRHVAKDEKEGFCDLREHDRRIELVLQRENLW